MSEGMRDLVCTTVSLGLIRIARLNTTQSSPIPSFSICCSIWGRLYKKNGVFIAISRQYEGSFI